MATEARLCPIGVFVSSNNEVYIADSSNHRIRKILLNGNIVTIAGNGHEGYSGDGGPATSANLSFPDNVFVSSRNEVYILDFGNYCIRKILVNGNIETIAGNGQKGYSGDNGPATSAQLDPFDVFVSPNNEVFIADQGNHRIRKILENGDIVTIAGTGKPGYSGDNGPATNAQLNCPTGVFVSSKNEVYIADLWNHRIRKILENGNIVTIAGTGEVGYSGDGGSATIAKLNSPKYLLVSPSNEVYFVDQGNQAIRKVLKNGNIETIAGNGQRGYSGDNGHATNAMLNNPYRMFVAPNNEVYIADTENYRIRKVLENGNIVTIAGNGEKGYCGDSDFDISEYPHIGGFTYSTKRGKTKLKRHERDLLFNSSIYAFIPLIEVLSPFFCKFILKNELLISSMNSIQLEIIQKIIDYLIYNDEIQLKFNNDEILDVLF